MHDETVTLFNRHGPEGNWRWYPVTFSGVTAHAVHAEHGSANAGQINADAVELSIPTSADRSVRIAGSGEIAQYADPKVYAAMENPAERFTFAPDRDFFFLGGLPEEVELPILDNDYDGGFYHAMNAEYDGVYRVSSAVFYRLIPHFEIGGR